MPSHLLTTEWRGSDAAAAARPRVVAVLGWLSLALCVVTGLTEGGPRSAVSSAGVYMTAVAGVAIVRGHVDWARLGSRAVAAVVGLLAIGAAAIGPGNTGDSEPINSEQSAAAASTSSTITSPPAVTPTDAVEVVLASAAHGTALEVLASMPVIDQPASGYGASAFGKFGPDSDQNGCDQRNDVLRRDLVKVTLRAGTTGCAVATGTLVDPYSGRRVKLAVKSAAAVSVDHVVSLRNAWATGASGWSETRRNEFANDLVTLQATTTDEYQLKRGDDAQAWLPSRAAYRCTYVARQIGIKRDYGLGVTSGERAAMARVLATCADRSVVTARVVRLGGAPIYRAPGSKPKPELHALVEQPVTKPKPKPASKPAPSRQQGVHPGAFCFPQGAFGYTNRGTLMHCRSRGGDQARWRAA